MTQPEQLLHGAVIMFDGPDWIGKTTQVAMASEALKQQDYNVWTTRVNGGTPIGEALRAVMLGDYERPVMTDLYIHLAQQHSLQVELARKRQERMVILIDRSPLSIIAYQVYGEGLDQGTGYSAADEVIAIYQPDLMIAYTAPPEILQKRRAQANHPDDYFEKHPSDYFDRVTNGYTVAADHYGARLIDASVDAGAVHAETILHIGVVLKSLSSSAANASVIS